MADTTSVRISWKPPSDDGGAVLTKYSVAAVDAPQHACEVPSTDSSCVITGLSAEIAYTFTVQAHNRKGVGPASEPSLPVTPIMALPGPPQNVMSRPGNMQITVSWRPPLINGGGTLTAYVVALTRVGDTTRTCTAGPGDTTCVFIDLLNDSAYYFTVRARNAAGLGPTVAATDTVYPSRYADWTQTLQLGTSFLGIDWAGNQFIAVGQLGSLHTSPDGLNWTSRTSGATYGLYSAASGNGVLAVVGSRGVIRTSPDGATWTARSSTQDATVTLRKIIWTGTQFVVAGGTESEVTGVILTSPNGTTWTSRGAGTHGGLLRSVAWAPSYTVTPGNGLAIAVGNGGMIRTSPDGANWTTRASGTTAILRGVAWGAPASAGATGLRVAVGDGGTVVTSTDGINWSVRQVGTVGILDVTWTGTHFVAIGWEGVVHHSADGLVWRTTKTSHSFNGRIASNGTRLLTLAGSGVLSNP